jgi:hypothetical protein
LVQGDEGPAQVVRWGIAALHRLLQRRSCHLLAARPIESFSSAAKQLGLAATVPTPAGPTPSGSRPMIQKIEFTPDCKLQTIGRGCDPGHSRAQQCFTRGVASTTVRSPVSAHGSASERNCALGPQSA